MESKMPSSPYGTKPMAKMRLDAALTERGLCRSRSLAQALILAGDIWVNGQMRDKASSQVQDEDIIELREKPPYVSRGGLKLEKAFEAFGLCVKDQICLDIGASTGGFTDCLLQRGAQTVYALDVGHGQLDYRLRQDARVVVMERYNARHLNPADFPPIQFACADVAFISLKLILPPLLPCMGQGAQGVVLIKPQFEAGRELLGKNGVVRDPLVRGHVCLDIMRFAHETGLFVGGLTASPITGPKGNHEYLLHLYGQYSEKALAAEAYEAEVERVIQNEMPEKAEE